MKQILLVFGLIMTCIDMSSQSIMIGSGLNRDTLMVMNYNDTVFSGVVASRDAVDIFTSIPVERKQSKFSFHINGEFVSSIVIPKRILKKRTRLYVDFFPYRKETQHFKHYVEYRIIDKN